MTPGENVCIGRNGALVGCSVRIFDVFLRKVNVVFKSVVIEPDKSTCKSFRLAESVIHIALVEPDG